MGSGGTPSRKKSEYYNNGTIPWLKSGELNNGIVSTAEEYITEEALKKSSAKIAPKGSLLVAMYGATAGKVGLLNFDSSMNQAVCFIKPDNEIANTRYLYYYLMSKNQELLDKREGGGQPNISQTILKALKIPLPSLSEQKAIVAKLDRAQRLIDIDKAMLAKYDQLIQSVFLEMFGDPVTNPMGWEVKKLGDVAEIDRTSFDPTSFNGTMKYLGLDCIEKETGKIIDMEVIEEGEVKSNKFKFTPEHVLYGKLRPYLNKVAFPYFEGICSTDIIPIKPRKNYSEKLFIGYLLKTKEFVDYADKNSSGANLPRISPKMVESFDTICPPMNLQKQFVQIVSRISGEKSKINEDQLKSEALFSSLVQEVFG